MEPQTDLKKKQVELLDEKYVTCNLKKEKPLDMLNIILDSAEETIHKREARYKEITQCAARRNKVLENTNIKEKIRDIEGRIMNTRITSRRE